MQFYAKDIMNELLISVRPETTCKDAMSLFTFNKISGAPVVNSEGVIVGVVTRQDILNRQLETPYDVTLEDEYFTQDLLDQKMGETGFHLESGDCFVSDLMNRTLYTVYPDSTVEELAGIMYQNRIHRVIILKPNEQKPIGIVTTFDLLKLLAESPSDTKATLFAHSPVNQR